MQLAPWAVTWPPSCLTDTPCAVHVHFDCCAVWSEDPYLTSRFVIEFVSGIQQEQKGYLQSIACCKHFAACEFSAPPVQPVAGTHTHDSARRDDCASTTDDVENIPVSRFVFDAQVTARTMWETYLPAFEACIVEAKAQSVMCS